MHAATESTVGAGDHALTANELRKSHEAIGDELGMFHDVRGVRDHAGDERLALGQPHLLPYLPLMLVADVARFNRQRACTHGEQEIDDVAERDVGEMRAVPARSEEHTSELQ